MGDNTIPPSIPHFLLLWSAHQLQQRPSTTRSSKGKVLSYHTIKKCQHCSLGQICKFHRVFIRSVHSFPHTSWLLLGGSVENCICPDKVAQGGADNLLDLIILSQGGIGFSNFSKKSAPLRRICCRKSKDESTCKRIFLRRIFLLYLRKHSVSQLSDRIGSNAGLVSH